MRLFEKTPEAMTGSRIAAVDYAKTLAIVCVVMIHVSSEVLLGRQIGSAAWLEGLFWSSLARGAVPLFLMCSGVLFLDRSGGLSVRRIWKRNIPHILLALLVWAAVYKLVPRFLHERLTAEALRTILLELLCGQHEGHLYFLHIMLLVYAALPVTYTFAANADEKRSAMRWPSGSYPACSFRRPRASDFSMRFPAFFCNGRLCWPGPQSAAPGWGIF